VFKPLCDWREVARDVRGRVLECGHFLPEDAPRAVLRDLRRFLARV
jgi:haloacetate dehalogenase